MLFPILTEWFGFTAELESIYPPPNDIRPNGGSSGLKQTRRESAKLSVAAYIIYSN